MTRTARKLLDHAKSKDHGTIAFYTGFYTGRSCRRSQSYGSRMHDAAIALRDAGYLEFVSHNRGVHHFVGGFSADHYTEHCYRITDVGRKA